MSEAPHVVEGVWRAPSSTRRLFYRWWKPATSRTALVILHGFAEHSGRYHAMANALGAHGISVLAPDLWGHGRSDGPRGHCPDLAQLADDLDAFVSDVALAPGDQTRYALFGHSFGGLVAIGMALRQPQALRRLVVQSPLLDVGFPVPWWTRTLGNILAAVWPTVSLPMHLDANALSHDRAIVDAYRTDPLIFGTMSAGTYRAMRRAQREALANVRDITQPTLVLCGAADRIISVAAAQHWCEQLRCEKRSVIFPECAHELHHESVKDEVFRVIREWVQLG